MSEILLIDTSEPHNLEDLLKQSCPVTRMALNQSSKADYYFGGADGKTRQFNRVQAGELLSNIDSMEDELRRYYDNADENYQIIEGIISPVAITKKDKSLLAISTRRQISNVRIYSYKMSPTGFIFGERAWDISNTLLFAWLRGLERCGIITYYTLNWMHTAQFLSAYYKSEQKPPENHTTLRRYYRPKIVTQEQNPLVKALMYLSIAYKIGIGEDRAKRIAAEYDSILDIAMSSVDELYSIDGIGREVARKLFNAIGWQIEK